ncbi:MAG: hypothetical protein K0R87_3527, partial [Pseudonocardia sp.]|nr:hypothetical protein [Pseudonocardia sp.]
MSTTDTEPTAEEILADAASEEIGRPVTVDGVVVDGGAAEDEQGVPLHRLALYAGPPAGVAGTFGLLSLSPWWLAGALAVAAAGGLAWLRRD